MARYKVPQDVEADDKLIGPFSFRQFVYLLIAGGLIALAVGLFQIFPALAIIPVPFILFFGALALPLKKDQPMETYLVAVISYYLKPHKRVWTPGQRESTIMVSAPKIEEDTRTRDITGEEATHRLSFLADIVDTEGYAIKGMGTSRVDEELVAEANATNDMFETNHFDSLEHTIVRDESQQREEILRGMREAIEKNNAMSIPSGTTIQKRTEPSPLPVVETPVSNNVNAKSAEPSIMELANNDDFSVATIAKEANRIKEKEDGEVFISLH